MNTDTILRLLTNAGFHNLHTDGIYVYMEDPSCVLRSFETFAEFAWLTITVFTGLMLAGWAISMIRGAKNDIFNNLKNLILLFGVLSALGPIINLIYGDDIFARGCKTISTHISELNQLLDARNKRFSIENELYERLDIYDTGPVYEQIDETDTIYDDEPDLTNDELLNELESYNITELDTDNSI